MIPHPEILAWKEIADWPLDEQVEQDLIISAALVKMFSYPPLKGKLAFRGGTALNKLIFPKPLRYSEDIDMNRLENSEAGPILDAIRESLKDLFPNIKPKSKRTKLSIKLIYSYPSTIDGGTRNLKIEINVRETIPQKPLEQFPFAVTSNFFSGSATIISFNREEMIGTKIRALYQRSKGRDLFDLFELSKLDFNWDNIVDSFLKLENIDVTGKDFEKDFEKNLTEKIQNKSFLEDTISLLPKSLSYNPFEPTIGFLGKLYLECQNMVGYEINSVNLRTKPF
jgi:predicted nucleotidyltransferase component of viral defense system